MRPDAIQWKNTREMLSIELKPRHSIRRRLQHCIYFAIILQAIFALFIVTGLQFYGDALLDKEERAAHLEPIASTIAILNVDTNPRHIRQLLWQFAQNDNIAFVTIRDNTNSKLLYSQINDGEVWNNYTKEQKNHPEKVTSGNSSLFSWLAINPTIVHEIDISASEAKGGNSEPSRYSLVVSEANIPAYKAMVLGGVGLIVSIIATCLLVLPFSNYKIKKMTNGLKSLYEEMQQFTKSGKPQPLNVGGKDEIGFLNVAYNELASRLLQSRQKLIEANEQLERQVERRTEELREAAKQLEEIATHDALTGLANRRILDKRLDSMFATPLPESEDIYCILLDMDGFKDVNDTLGHDVGDELLCLLSGFLKRTCRQTDVAVRFGGDEFMLLLRLKDSKNAISIANRILDQFTEAVAEMFKDSEELETLPSLSFGISGRKTSECSTAEEMIQFADKALYQAKNAGKSQAIFYNHDLAA